MSAPLFKLLFIFLVATVDGSRHFSYLDYLQRECDKGNQTKCERLEQEKQNAKKGEELIKFAQAFGKQVNGADYMMEHEKPNLQAIYPIIIKDFFSDGKDKQGKPKTEMQHQAVNYCAEHFHNIWINQKLWWPTDIDDKPDWTQVYYFVIDHYYGLCLRQTY